MTKMTVHNIMEVKALIKEEYAKGNEANFNGTGWYDHSGNYLCTSHIDDVDFKLDLEDRSTLTVDVI